MRVKKPPLSSVVCWLLLSLTVAGCATPTPDVGAVVVAPQAQLPPVPELVRKTEPKPAGYFQRSLLDYFCGSSVKPTPSTTPTPCAAPMP